MTEAGDALAVDGVPSSARARPASTERGDESGRAGQDERQRGWFWHWNGIVTQYTPLIGLKGIGLLNSYTVWTDRREGSPHHGYAFPSQQSEANFYGEDRAELITINKILVALDLIEIRKEMIRKVDAQGRRWKVPQNLYRVKDRQNGLDLTSADVLRVIELADRDQSVYRYIRRLFSSKFEPIDRDNVWRAILIELEEHPTWKKLAAKAGKQEARASARTKAGHRARAGRRDESEDGSDSVAVLTNGHIDRRPSIATEQPPEASAQNLTSVDLASNGFDPVDERANRASEAVAEPANDGCDENEGGSVASANNGRDSSVEQGNTTYYEASTTTTTTTSPSKPEADQEQVGGEPPTADGEHVASAPLDAGAAGESGRSSQWSLADLPGAGPMADPSALVVSLYEAANDRPASGLERVLLSELERDAAAPAAAAGSTGPEWVAAALREAVGSGSAFVAPKRIREIINRWSAAGAGPRGPGLKHAPASDHTRHADAISQRDARTTKQSLDVALDKEVGAKALQISRTDHQQGEQLWSLVLDLLAAEGAGSELLRLRGVVPLGQRADGAFLLGAPTRLASRLLSGRFRQAVEQALSSLLSSPVEIAILDQDQWSVVD